MFKILLLSLPILFSSCFLFDIPGRYEIDIGNYEYEKNAWNEQNISDYQIAVTMDSHLGGYHTTINVKNDVFESYVPCSCDAGCSCLIYCSGDIYCCSWETNFLPTTIPDIFSGIEKDLQSLNDLYNKKEYDNVILQVLYDEKYHYPKRIEKGASKYTSGGKDGFVGGYWNYVFEIEVKF